MNCEEKTLGKAVLVLLVREDKILLAWKPKSESGKRKIGEESWNGPGGGIEEGEGPLIAAIREPSEELKIKINRADLQRVAILHFQNVKSDGSKFLCVVYVFMASNWEGEPQASKEMTDPTFFEIGNIPFDEMMPADRHWLPLVLRGEKIIAEATLGPGQKTLLSEVVIRPMKRTMDCEICGEMDINPIVILPISNGKGAYNTLACEKCARESGCYCEKHKRPHIALAGGGTRCVCCYEGLPEVRE
ncbi:MAG: NUDIX domain-containing protein [Candidatus Colwellbacteria bacterium]|nr:NUDIX domain-containing protein [Candidatus Colwellbacteria bacterium]